MESFEQGDAWVMEGAHDPINFGGNCSAGLPADQRSGWVRWEERRSRASATTWNPGRCCWRR
jgi:hypothetical protein